MHVDRVEIDAAIRPIQHPQLVAEIAGMIGEIRRCERIVSQPVKRRWVQRGLGIGPQLRSTPFKRRAQVSPQIGPTPVHRPDERGQHRAEIVPALADATFQHQPEHLQTVEEPLVALPDILSGMLAIQVMHPVQHWHVVDVMQGQKLKDLVVEGADMLGEPDVAIVQKVAAVDPAPDARLALHQHP